VLVALNKNDNVADRGFCFCCVTAMCWHLMSVCRVADKEGRLFWGSRDLGHVYTAQAGRDRNRSDGSQEFELLQSNCQGKRATHMTSIATMSLSCTVSEILSLISLNLKKSR